MLLRSYLLGKFSKQLVFYSSLFSLLILASQLYSTAYLILSLPAKYSVPYLIMVSIYSFFLSLAFSLTLTTAFFIHQLKESKFFHILYTFGFSERKLLKELYIAIFLFSVAGIISSFSVNYQKISHLTKYLKFKFGEEILLTVPPKTFFSTEKLSVYFEERNKNRFKHIVIRFGKEIGTAETAELNKEGILTLNKITIFSPSEGGNYILKSDTYSISLASPYFYKPPHKKVIKEFAFFVALFLFPPMVFPILFYLISKRINTRLKATLTGILFVIIQFVFALTVKVLV